MRAGDLDSEVVIQQETETGRDAYNQPIVTWTTFVTAWAKHEPGRAARPFEDGTRFSKVVHRFMFRFEDVEGVGPKMRLSLGGQIYEIVGIMPSHSTRQFTSIDAVLFDGSQTVSA